MLTHKGTKELTTKRLKLRRFTVDDAQDMFNNWASDAEVTKFVKLASAFDTRFNPRTSRQMG